VAREEKKAFTLSGRMERGGTSKERIVKGNEFGLPIMQKEVGQGL